MIIDINNTKVRNAFIVMGALGFLLMFLPLSFESSQYQNCIDRVGSENRELCELPQHLHAEAVINPIHTKLMGVASMILGCLFLVASMGYFVTKLLKREVSKMRSDVSQAEPLRADTKRTNGKTLLEMKQLLDEKLITEEEFEACKKSYLGK